MTLTMQRHGLMRGSLSHINLKDVLLLAVEGKKSGLLKLFRGRETVEVFLTEGKIVHADSPIGDGEKALLYPVTWTDGTFVLGPNGSPPAQTIDKDPGELLAEVKAMSQEWEQILQVIPSGRTVFRIAELHSPQNNGSINIPHEGWRVLGKIDGQRSVQAIADTLRQPCAHVAKVIFDLYTLALIETVSPDARHTTDTIPPGFFDHLICELTDAIGPIASFLLQEQIAFLGESTDAFPKARLEELIELISTEISDETPKSRFQEGMFAELQTFKAL